MKIVILTGAGISAESGIKTFRDHDGLWEGHDVHEVATPEGWNKNPALVQEFYNQRRAQLAEVKPNLAHLAINKLQDQHEVVVITQNVDDLHEKAGNEKVIHLHGELKKIRCTICAKVSIREGALNIGDKCDCGGQLRPHIVWFGEAVPMLEKAILECSDAQIAIVVGTSMQVYPAAGLVGYLPLDCSLYYVDPKPSINYELAQMKSRLQVYDETATQGLPKVIDLIIQHHN